MQKWQSNFENTYYKKEWKQKTFFTRRLYKIGTICENEDGTFTVYDGAHNWMGTFDSKGNIKYNGKASEYSETFMKSAVEFATKEKKINKKSK